MAGEYGGKGAGAVPGLTVLLTLYAISPQEFTVF